MAEAEKISVVSSESLLERRISDLEESVKDYRVRISRLERWQFGLCLLAGVLGFLLQAAISVAGWYRG